MPRTTLKINSRLVRAFAVASGVLLVAIGVRFLLMPADAVRSFGFRRELANFELQHVIGLRDIWLGLLAVALAWMKQWQALALWFGIAAVICFADAMLVWQSSARVGATAFHIGCGILAGGLAMSIWRLTPRI